MIKISPEHQEKAFSYLSDSAAGKSVLDVGGLWGVQGDYSFHAEDCKASRVVLLDVSSANSEFLEKKKNRGSAVEFVQGDVTKEETPKALGLFDIVLCLGVLYHVLDPINCLKRLRELCSGRLLLGSLTMAEIEGYKQAAVYLPHLEEAERKKWDAYWFENTDKIGLCGEFRSSSLYGNWCWAFSPSAVDGMLKTAGFTVEQSFYLGKYYLAECR